MSTSCVGFFRPFAVIALWLAWALPAAAQVVATQVAAGLEHTCALSATGTVKCWGANESGQLGDGSRIAQGMPVDVVGLPAGIRFIAANYVNTCAITNAGRVHCWGGGLGGRPSDPVPGLERATFVGVGRLHACAIADGEVKCWGQPGGYGVVGEGTTSTSNVRINVPVVLGALGSGVKSLAVGLDHNCAVTAGGAVKCWGRNDRSQLGHAASMPFSAVPVGHPDLGSNVREMLANEEQSCALMDSGLVRCWGVYEVGKNSAGNPVDMVSATPVAIAQAEGATALWRGHWHNCATVPGGALRCWGWNEQGQLGDGTHYLHSYRYAVTASAIVSGTVAAAGGAHHTCAVVGAGSVRCWGDNSKGQLGDGGNSSIKSGVMAAGFGIDERSYQGLWWRSPAGTASGWGVNLAHQGDVLFATWFTYDIAGRASWLVMSNGRLDAAGSFSGTLYRTTGPAYNATAWNPAQVGVQAVGNASFRFVDEDNAVFTTVVDGVSMQQPITRQVFQSRVPACRIGGTHYQNVNYQDLWWRTQGAESGWGLNITHQGDVLFLTWFTYDATGRAVWYVASDARPSGPNAWSGKLYQTSGPPSSQPFDPSRVTVTEVGTATVSFTDAENGSFTYAIGASTQTKPITRQRFATPPTVCH